MGIGLCEALRAHTSQPDIPKNILPFYLGTWHLEGRDLELRGVMHMDLMRPTLFGI